MNTIIIATIIVIIIILCYYWHLIMINVICIASVKRGILSPNKFWWGVSDILTDKTGVELFYATKQKHPQFYETNVLGNSMVLVLDMNTVKYILDNSPDLFTVGTLKYKFFQSFMKYNVGVLSGGEWLTLRKINENVLHTGMIHQYNEIFSEIIKNDLARGLPMNFYQFNQSAKNIADLIIFGRGGNQIVYDAIAEANHVPIISQNLKHKEAADLHVRKFLNNPIKNTLISLLSEHDGDLEYFVDQVYHFVFPMVSLITIHVPRILAMIVNRIDVKNKLPDPNYLIKCIMETLRLNPPVISFFRKSSVSKLGFPAETDFLILSSPLLRDPEVFSSPDEYHPDRWTPELMKLNHNMIFGLGPQSCPGQDLSISILTIYITTYMNRMNSQLVLEDSNILYLTQPKISYAINPYKIKFQL